MMNYNNDKSRSIQELERIIGVSIRLYRVGKNLTRENLAARASLSPEAIKNLENGRGSTLKTLLKVMRGLGRLEWIRWIAPMPTTGSASAINKPVAIRARPKRFKKSVQTDT